MSVVPRAVEPTPVAESPPPRNTISRSWLVAGCYLVFALFLTGRLWANPAQLMQAGDTQDVNLFAWFLRYSATAVAHGHLPALVTTAMGAPRGVNMMWNTSFLLPGVLLSPVTLAAGPQVSLTLALTLSLAGSAASLFWVLRRWGASIGAAALGGAMYGFSPALINSGIGHYQLVLAVLPPLIIHELLRILTGRGSPARAGAWLGVFTAAQLFIGEEELVYTAVAALALLAALALGHPHAVRDRVPGAALGAVTAAAVTLLISGYALWVQFLGPLREHNLMEGQWSGDLGLFVEPPGTLLFHTPASAAIVAAFPLNVAEVLSYLGWPLIIVLVAAAIWFWRIPRIRAAVVTCVVLELCSQGGGPLSVGGFRLSGRFLPYHWLQGLPAMAQLIPGRFTILGVGAAGAVVAFSLDAARTAAPKAPAWRRYLPATVAVLAALPLIPLPYQPAPLPPVPAGWRAAFTRLQLAPDARVLVVPVTLIAHTQIMRWQADTGEPQSMIGGYFLTPNPAGQGVFSMFGEEMSAAEYLNALWAGTAPLNQPRLVRSALAYWRPAVIVAVTQSNSRLGQFLTGLLGPPTFEIARILVWQR